MDETIQEIVEGLRTEWENGKGSALIEAFVWCTNEGVDFPQWLTRAVFDELKWSWANRPREGGNKSNSEAREASDHKHQVRFALVNKILEFQQFDLENGLRAEPINKTEAARDAQRLLEGTANWGDIPAILKSYRDLQRRQRRNFPSLD